MAGEHHIRIPLVKPVDELGRVAEKVESVLKRLAGKG
jgi:hypothetical protein